VKSQFDDDEDFSESHKVDSKVNHHNKGAISDQPNNDVCVLLDLSILKYWLK